MNKAEVQGVFDNNYIRTSEEQDEKVKRVGLRESLDAILDAIFGTGSTEEGGYVSWEQYQTTGNKIATITIGSRSIDVYAPEGGGSGPLQPTVTKPSVSITLSEAGTYEVGTSITPHYDCSFEDGRYTYGPEPTGSEATGWTITDGEHTSSSPDGQFDTFTVDDNTEYYVEVSAQYTQGNVAKDSMGGDSDPVKKIEAGTATGRSSYVSGYRNFFYTTTTNPNGIDITGLTSNDIRQWSKTKQSSTFNMSLISGVWAIAIAIPNTNTLTKVFSEAQNQYITGNFNKVRSLSVGGVNNYNPITYDIYYYLMDASYSNPDTLTLTIS